MAPLETCEQRRADLTCWVEYRRAEYLRLKGAREYVTRAELQEALAGYQQAIEALSRFLHESGTRSNGRLKTYIRPE